MAKAQYDIYVDKVKDLVRTLVVKSDATAVAVNQGLQARGYAVQTADPTTWKYYLHLAGVYHATDTLMTVTSLDTLQTIEFTRDNLQVHIATAAAYTYGSRYYNDLYTRFPDQESLIRGVLNPVDINKAIAAEEGTILWYDPTLVESNETNLIPLTDAWIKRYLGRWDVSAMAFIDELYVASLMGVMWHQLPMVIMNIRLVNCHTYYAHSYHIQEFLASHGALDQYVSNLTKKQMLWLYRNIRYIMRNAGKQDTFNWLIKNILTDRGLPLAAWSMRHNVKDQAEDIYPVVEFQRKSLNYEFSNAGVDTRSVAELLQAEEPMARSNALVEYEAEIDITKSMEHSMADRLQTKILESAVLDLTDAAPFTLSDCLLNHWIYFAHTGRYKAVINVDDPHTGDLYTFSALDAFIVFMYAFNAARGLVLPTIPTIEASKVRQVPTPTREILLGLIDTSIVNPNLVTQALTHLPPVQSSYLSIASFNEGVRAIHAGEMYHRLLYTGQEHFVARGQVEQMTLRFYCDYPCALDGNQSYPLWFKARGLDIESLSTLEMDLLATSILAEATGANLTVTQSLKDLQTAMLRLMTQLSSYSIQYLQTINSSTIRVLDWAAIRLGDESVTGGDDIKVPAINVDAQEINAKAYGYDNLELAETLVDFEINARCHMEASYDVTVDMNLSGSIHLLERAEIPMASVLRVIDPFDEDQQPEPTEDQTNQYVPLTSDPLSTAFSTTSTSRFALTGTDKNTLLNLWSVYANTLGELLPDLGNAVTQPVLNGIPPIGYPLENIHTELNGLTSVPGITYPLDNLNHTLGDITGEL